MDRPQIVIDTNVIVAALLSQYGAPFLKDPNDDMVLELAVSAGCDAIVTYNKRDFVGVERFGIRALTALEFLKEIGEVS